MYSENMFLKIFPRNGGSFPPPAPPEPATRIRPPRAPGETGAGAGEQVGRGRGGAAGHACYSTDFLVRSVWGR